jgi:peptidoglycan/xylan/chitin deacetylase (PgdA/CDA1 family)
MLFHAGQLDDAAAAAIAAAVGTQLRLPQIRSDRMAIRSIIDGLKHQPASHIDAVLLNVETLLGKSGVVVTDNHPDRFMSWKQAAALRDSGMVTIGSHCCSHTPLTKLRLPEVEAELTTSRRIIGELAGATPCSLAYPNGDCSNEIAHATAAAGYAVAFSTERGYVSTADNPQQLRRINVHEHSTDSDGTFLARIAMLH